MEAKQLQRYVAPKAHSLAIEPYKIMQGSGSEPPPWSGEVG